MNLSSIPELRQGIARNTVLIQELQDETRDFERRLEVVERKDPALALYEYEVDMAAHAEMDRAAEELVQGPVVDYSGIRGGDFWAELQAEHGL